MEKNVGRIGILNSDLNSDQFFFQCTLQIGNRWKKIYFLWLEKKAIVCIPIILFLVYFKQKNKKKVLKKSSSFDRK